MSGFDYGVPGVSRTRGLLLRRQSLYPSELRGHEQRHYPQYGGLSREQKKGGQQHSGWCPVVFSLSAHSCFFKSVF